MAEDENQDSNKQRLQDVSQDAHQAEREQLVTARRVRQHGRSSSRSRILVSASLIGAALLLFIALIGPKSISGMFSGLKIDAQKASKVDMNVAADHDQRINLDFTVPAEPLPDKPAADPNVGLNDKLKALQAQIVDIERSKKTSVTSSEIQQMLAQYNQTLSLKFEQQQKELSDENIRLRDEFARAEDARRRAEEEAKRAVVDASKRAELDKAQRESNAVVVNDGVANGGSLGQFTEAGSQGADLSKNLQFLKSAASSVVATSVSNNLPDPSRTVVQGTIISAVLETAIDTELPGSLRAVVMNPVFSFDGSNVLMPQGTILIGQFNNQVELEQKRVQIAWNRAIMPDGKSINIGSIGTDRLGRAGTKANVDNRYAKRFGAAVLLSSISAVPALLSQNVGSSGSRQDRGTTINVGSGGGGSGGGDIVGEIGKSLNDKLGGVVEDYLKLPPIIRVPQGEEIRVFVNNDLVFR